jgi:hypothetical protein
LAFNARSDFDSFTVIPIVENKPFNTDAVHQLANITPQQKAADSLLLDAKMQTDEACLEIVNSRTVHVLSAFAIAEDNPTIFRRIVRFLSLKGWELPRSNGLYDHTSWDAIRLSRSLFFHSLVSEAIQTAIRMDWFILCDALVNFARSKQFVVSITADSVSALIENEAYDLMNNLLDRGVFL